MGSLLEGKTPYHSITGKPGVSTVNKGVLMSVRSLEVSEERGRVHTRLAGLGLAHGSLLL